MLTEEPTKSSSLFSVVNGAVSFASVLTVIVLTYLIQFLLESRILGSINSGVLGIVMFITVILLYVLVIFGPAIIVYIKLFVFKLIYIINRYNGFMIG